MADRDQRKQPRTQVRWSRPPFIAGATGVPGDMTIIGTAPVHRKLGRNDPCWCGSGMKYKRCHLAADLSE